MDNDELKVIEQYKESDNLYVKALCNDVICCNSKDKRVSSKEASRAYLSLYRESHRPQYLIRSIAVRIQPLKDKGFINELCDALAEKCYPAWLPKVSKLLRKQYSSEELSNLIGVANNVLKKPLAEECHREDERNCLKALSILGSLDNNCLFRELALSHEKELDWINSNAKPGVVQMNNADIAQRAFNEIQKVKTYYPEDFSRIKGKLQNERSRFAEYLQQYGVKIRIGLSEEERREIDDAIDQFSFSKIEDVIDFIKELPIIPKALVDEKCAARLKVSPMLEMFGGENIGHRGQTLGKAECEDNVRIRLYQGRIRPRVSYYVYGCILKGIEGSEQMSSDNICNIICSECSASYITKDSSVFWSHGIMAGLCLDWISAVHVLIPQIERALRLKAESLFGDLTQYGKTSHQDESGFSNVLTLLKPHFREDMYNDLWGFLMSGADVNLRNNIAHGLISPSHCKYYGPYLLWVAMKLYFCEEEIFIN